MAWAASTSQRAPLLSSLPELSEPLEAVRVIKNIQKGIIDPLICLSDN
jgi:hypothetical protein